ncbi:MAG TPA: hypothetical protein VKB58_05650 [Terriglobales bacterium]|jgi:hypothetical protein|nr:hypothetical protein [Terriglobales bacterium]
MPFDVKELMIDITKTGAQGVGGAQILCAFNTQCHPTFCLCTYQFSCACTYHFTYCITPTHVTCTLGTYTCYGGTIITCGPSIFCAGTQDPTWYEQAVNVETVAALKTQLHAALAELDKAEKRLQQQGKQRK